MNTTRSKLVNLQKKIWEALQGFDMGGTTKETREV